MSESADKRVMAPAVSKILLVDPEGALRVAVSTLLEADGFHVEEADDVADALDRVAAGVAYDIIIAETRSPGTFELTERIAATDPTIATILVDAEASHRDGAVRAVRAGAFDLIPAEFTVADCRVAIERASIRRRRLIEFRDEDTRFESAVRRREEAVLGEDGLRPLVDSLLRSGTGTLPHPQSWDRKDSLLNAVRDFVATIEAQNPEIFPQGHAARVGRFASLLGQRSNRFVGSEIVQLEIAALLHDIGKVATPGAESQVVEVPKFSAQPGSVGRRERERRRRHPVIGGRIVRAFDRRDLEHAVRHHHEHYDGTGYPDGLRGNAIPFGAQIIHAADSLEHMVARSPGGPGLSIEHVINEFDKGSGKRFNPEVVELVRCSAGVIVRTAPTMTSEHGADLAEAS